VSAEPITIHDVPSFRAAVLTWYAANGRALNFRRRRDPYAVLVSEIMAQQTQISRVEPAWEAFLTRFETVEALAAAPVSDVLRAWQGLGYNRRALNLQRAARVVVADFGGQFPETVGGLEGLPGIGAYTARAVAAISYGHRVGAVDTNVRRVLGRAAAGWSGGSAGQIQALADEVVPAGRPGEWTHALMDIGARFCRPQRPLCDECPARAGCVAARETRPTAPRDTQAEGAGSRAPRRQSRSGSRAATRRIPFRTTARWLRGRLVDRARDIADDTWARVDGPMPPHDEATVLATARTLAAEGLLEFHPTDPTLVRLAR